MEAGHDLVVIERAPSTALAEEMQSLLDAEGIKASSIPTRRTRSSPGELTRSSREWT